ncbi:MAG TPA: tRNA lysidine(34) synthetase TilS, partial [Verrucomicrobiae bacterium]|nr:tRNA lysidine(34) synthetase TilS [Verrucomicrobiae bacterium]
RGLSFRHDSSNDDTRFTRNRIRHELLPVMRGFNPSVSSTLARTAAVLGEESALIEEMAGSLRESAAVEGGLDISVMRRAPRPLRLRVYRCCLEQAGGEGEVSQRHLVDLDSMLLSPRPCARLSLPGGREGVKAYGRLLLRRAAPRGEEIRLEVTSAGCHRFPGGSLRVTEAPPPANAAAPPRSTWVDLDAAPFPWTLRSRRPGDRLVPLGMSGSRKVKEVLIDCKVPRELRERIPLLTDAGGEVVWVCGVRRGGHARITPGTRRAALLEIVLEGLNDL